MTSNLGSQFLLEGNKGTEEIAEETRDLVLGQLKNHFRPEFLNRVDEIILFKPLTLQNIKEIVVKLMKELQARLSEQQIKLSINDEAKEYIAENGFDPVYGARPLKLFIQRNLETKIARSIIAGEIRESQQVTIVVQNNDIGFEIE